MYTVMYTEHDNLFSLTLKHDNFNRYNVIRISLMSIIYHYDHSNEPTTTQYREKL